MLPIPESLRTSEIPEPCDSRAPVPDAGSANEEEPTLYLTAAELELRLCEVRHRAVAVSWCILSFHSLLYMVLISLCSEKLLE